MQLLDLTVQGWLEELGDRGPAPGGGSAAALTAAMAAALVGMAARISAESWRDAPGVCAQTAALRVRLAGLAQADADHYGESLRMLEGAQEVPSERRDRELAAALDRAAQTPLAIAETAGDVVTVAFQARERVEPKVQADVDAAAALAAAAALSAARLVEVNLSARRDDPRVAQARAAAEAATRTMRHIFPPV
jgi:formiminotetrahydrofolate cyclodeaminase